MNRLAVLLGCWFIVFTVNAADKYTEARKKNCVAAVKNYKVMVKIQHIDKDLKAQGIKRNYPLQPISYPYSIEQIDEMLKTKHICKVLDIVTKKHADSMVR